MSRGESKVLVLGDGNRSFLAVIRSLGRRGVRVHVGWCSPDTPAARSRYVRAVHRIPPYGAHGAWKSELTGLMTEEQYELVIPCNDQSLLPLQAHRKELEAHGRLYLLGERAFEIAIDKVRTAALAASLGLPLPPAVVLRAPAPAEEVLAALSLPVVVKPATSFALSNLREKSKVQIARTREGLERALEMLLPRGEVLVQDYFSGHGVGVEALADAGEVLLAFQHERLHEPPTGGGSTYRRSVPLDPELLGATRRLVEATDYTGVLMVEFRVNAQTGEWILVELNPRFWGSLPLAVAAGADFPYYLYRLLVEGKRRFPGAYRTGLYCRNLTKDLGWLVRALREESRSLWGSVRLLGRTFGEMVINTLRLRERSDTFTFDDPMPGVLEVAQLARRAMRVASGRARSGWCSVPPARTLQTRKVRQALRNSRSVLFVCKGNICRSPFAEHYARRHLPGGARFASTGYYPVPERRCPPAAVEAAADLGVDLSGHRSSVIEAPLAREHDLVLTFDEENRRTLLDRYPWLRGKVFHVGLLAADGPVTIADPFGGTVEDMRAAYRAIARALDAYAGSVESAAR